MNEGVFSSTGRRNQSNRTGTFVFDQRFFLITCIHTYLLILKNKSRKISAHGIVLDVSVVDFKIEVMERFDKLG